MWKFFSGSVFDSKVQGILPDQYPQFPFFPAVTRKTGKDHLKIRGVFWGERTLLHYDATTCWCTADHFVCVCVCVHFYTTLYKAPVNADGDKTTFIHLFHRGSQHCVPVATTPVVLCSSPHDKHLQSAEKNNPNRRPVFRVEFKISEIRSFVLKF